jgi:hypothetical protein
MARSDSLRNDIARLETKGAGLEKDMAAAMKKHGDAESAARRKLEQAARTNSATTHRSSVTAAEREAKKATDAQKKIADIRGRVANNDKAIASKRTSLRSAEQQEQRARDREDDRRRRGEKQHAREIAQLARVSAPVRYVEVRPPKPEQLRVLYLTANPESTETTVQHADGSIETHGVWLRVDYEVRQVKAMLRGSKYRDLVTLEHLPAATSLDLLAGLNDHRPHVVHFSGHASSWGLLLENDEGTESGAGMDFELLARALGATDEPPRLLVLNGCESLAGADELLKTIPALIGMSAAINDTAAVTFAAHFYAAIASAQSMGTAVEQAKVAMQMASLDGSELPEVRTRDGLEPSGLILVRPPTG